MKAITAIAAIVLLGLTACGGGDGPDYYLATDSGQVLLVQWSAPQNGNATGSITQDQPSGTAPNQTLGVTTVPVSVTISGTQVTLTPTGIYALGGVTITGTLGSGNLTITVPPSSGSGLISSGTLAASDVNSYNTAVAALQKTINQGNAQAAAQQQAQAQQTQYAADSQAATTALSNLGAAVDFSSDLNTLNSDLTQVGSDLATVRQDASQGPNGFGSSYCSQLTGVVDSDVTGTLDADVSGSFGSDLNTLTSDIATSRQDITAVNTALVTLSSDGLPRPDNATWELSNDRSAIASAIGKANSDIATVNWYVDQGYAVANGIATGSCSGDGPGSPPTGIQPIS